MRINKINSQTPTTTGRADQPPRLNNFVVTVFNFIHLGIAQHLEKFVSIVIDEIIFHVRVDRVPTRDNVLYNTRDDSLHYL